MSRLLAVAVAALMLLAAVPAFAEDLDTAAASGDTAPAQHEAAVTAPATEAVPCVNPDALEVVTLDQVESEIAAPGLTVVDTETKSFVVDLGADSLEATAPLAVTMSWDALLNDYDLEVTADDTLRSENAQPFDPSEESVTVTVSHCQVIEVSAYNFFALQPATTLSLSFGPGAVDEDIEAPAAAVPSVEALDALEAAEALDAAEAVEPAAAL